MIPYGPLLSAIPISIFNKTGTKLKPPPTPFIRLPLHDLHELYELIP
jgi:hypothetical protein